MTPNEIAEALEARHKYDKINYPPASPLDRQAAATIRDLEAKLKIATEALDKIAHKAGIGNVTCARQALARIKEV